MANEKILTVGFNSRLTESDKQIWEANGWTVNYELNPMIAEFIDFTVDRTGSISDQALDELHREINGIMNAFPSPDSFHKAGEFMIPLDFTDNISHEDMERFRKEIDNG